MNTKNSTVLMAFFVVLPTIVLAADSSATKASNHLGAIVALMITTIAFTISYLMNHRTSAMRGLGLLTAAIACFSLVTWFGWAVQAGVINNPKPNQTQLDSAKPALLWLQISISLAAGIVLSISALRQFRNPEVLTLSKANSRERYGMISRLLHWTSAILFISLIPMGIFTSMIPEDAWYRNQYYVIHKSIGVLLVVLLMFRLLWNQVSKRPDLDKSLKPVERRWAHRAHLALYVLLIAVPLTGYVMTSLHGFATYFFIWEWPPLWPQSRAYIIWGSFHKYVLQYLIYLVLGAHILGALKHRYIDKHKTALKRMVF